LSDENKSQSLKNAISNDNDDRLYAVNPNSFSMVPGSPFAYWVSDRIRQLFVDLPPFESEERLVKTGLATADDFRFVRVWWEVSWWKILDAKNAPNWSVDVEAFQEWCRQSTFKGKKWVPFTKGGEYSPYYADIHLLVNWEDGGKEIYEFNGIPYGGAGAPIRNPNYYYKPGLTWPLRATHFCPQVMQSGTIFSVRGYGAFAPIDVIKTYLAFWNAVQFDYLYKIMLGRFGFPEFIVGILLKMPYFEFEDGIKTKMKRASKKIFTNRLSIERVSLTSRFFISPAIIFSKSSSIMNSIEKWKINLNKILDDMVISQKAIDEIGDTIIKIDGINLFNSKPVVSEDAVKKLKDNDELVGDTLFWFFGVLTGLWNINLNEKELSESSIDPFAPLPVSSPAMLTGLDGLPAKSEDVPDDYPIDIIWSGILVDDPGHPDDIIHRVRQVLEVIWKDKAESIEREASEILKVKSLRHYFRKSGAKSFWMDHVKRYSKSRRKAPIYWLLQSKRKNYAVWLYYHRLDRDIYFKVLVNYVEPKIRETENKINDLRTKVNTSDSGERKKAEQEIDTEEDFLSEMRDFHDKLKRVADLELEPDLDDGVVLNIAPLYELVPWKEAKKYWDDMVKGKYEWSSISKQLRERGVVK